MTNKLDEAIARQRTITLADDERAAFLRMGDETLDTDIRVAAMRWMLDASERSRAWMGDFYEILFRYNAGERPCTNTSTTQH
jgi:hypothetical protein